MDIYVYIYNYSFYIFNSFLLSLLFSLSTFELELLRISYFIFNEAYFLFYFLNILFYIFYWIIYSINSFLLFTLELAFCAWKSELNVHFLLLLL